MNNLHVFSLSDNLITICYNIISSQNIRNPTINFVYNNEYATLAQYDNAIQMGTFRNIFNDSNNELPAILNSIQCFFPVIDFQHHTETFNISPFCEDLPRIERELKGQYEQKYKTEISYENYFPFKLQFPTYDLYTYIPKDNTSELTTVYVMIDYCRLNNIYDNQIRNEIVIERGSNLQTLYYFEDGVRYKGDKYIGEFNLKKLRAHGKGKFLYVNGAKYVGEFKKGKRHGFGKYVYANGNYYVGEWKNDERSGDGFFENRETAFKYVGKWRKGLHCGLGFYHKDSNIFYYGAFNKHLFEGKGFKYEKNDNEHVHRLDIGEWKNSVLNGKGKYYDINNNWVLYEGDYKDDAAEGDGTFYRNGNLHYQGNFKGGRPHGYGIIFEPNGNKKVVYSNEGAQNNTNCLIC